MNKQMQTSGEGGEGGIAKLLLVCLFQQAFRIQVLCLNILEVAVSTHLQFFGGRIVTNDDTLFVHLQGADSPHLHHGTLDCMIEGTCLVVSVYDNHYLAGAKHSTDTDGQGSLGHLVHVVVKETGVGNDGIGSLCLLEVA